MQILPKESLIIYKILLGVYYARNILYFVSYLQIHYGILYSKGIVID